MSTLLKAMNTKANVVAHTNQSHQHA